MTDKQASAQMSAHEGFTYESPNLTDHTLDQNNLEASIPLDNGRHVLEPKNDLGALDQLPLEILDSILVQLDLRTLTDFRRVNQRAMQIVDAIPQYRTILEHSPASLRGLLAIETGRYISCTQLLQTLKTATCGNCHDFGGYIDLLACKRVCFLCFSGQLQCLPLLSTEVERKFGRKPSADTHLPVMKSLPGYYAPNKKLCRTRLTLFDHQSAHAAAERHYGSAQAMKQHVASKAAMRLMAYNDRMCRWSRHKDRPMPHRPPQAVADDSHSSNPRRFMAIVRAPWLDPLTKLSDWGCHCIGCEKEYRAPPLHWRRKYSQSTFEQHIEECGQIKDGRHHRDARLSER